MADPSDRDLILQWWSEHRELSSVQVAAYFDGLGRELLRPDTTPPKSSLLRKWKARHGLPDPVPTAGKGMAQAESRRPAAVWEDVHTIIPWKANPRDNDHAVEPVADSIMKFGYGRTFVAWREDADRMLVVGHTARKAVLLNLERYPDRCPPDAPAANMIPVRWRDDWTEADAKAYAIADNQLATISGWVDADLATLLRELDGDGYSHTLMGFDGELASLLAGLEGWGGGPPPPPPSSPWPSGARGSARVIRGDCVEVMATITSDSIDAIVCDPPYGIGFLGKEWDVSVPGLEWAQACLRVLKPGGHIIAFGGTRTVHRLAVAIEDAGFEIRDTVHWQYHTGYPKSLDVSKAIAKAAGGEEDIAKWQGWGTATKPAVEPAVLARKPLSEDTVAANVLRWGTGALNIDACRFAVGDPAWTGPQDVPSVPKSDPAMRAGLVGVAMGPGKNLDTNHAAQAASIKALEDICRWPANLYYCPKPSPSERRRGADGIEAVHPTQKPVKLMRWLVRLVTPPGGVVLDPFLGSGTTGIAAVLEGFQCVGIEREAEYADIADERIKFAIEADPDGD